MVRKATLAVVAVVLVGGIAAGAFAATELLGGDAQAVDQVPSDVDVVMRIDMAITNDDVTRQVANAGADQVSPAGPSNTSQALSEFENETGLDPNAADEIVAFSRQNGPDPAVDEQYAGFIVHADWDNDRVIETVRNESQTTYEETTVDGQTVYRPTGTLSSSTEWFAPIGDGQFVWGTERAVTDALNVSNGDAESFDGDLRAAYDDTREGLITFAVRVPTEQVPAGSGASQVDVSQYRKVSVVTGSYYTESNAAGVEARMIANSSSEARDVQDVTDGALSVASGSVQNETVKETLRSVEVTRDGDTVVVSYEQSVDSIRELVRYYQRLGA